MKNQILENYLVFVSTVKNNKEVVALGPFIAFLKDNSLYQSVINPKLIISDSNYLAMVLFRSPHEVKWRARTFVK